MSIIRNWQRNLSRILWTIFMVQFVIWFSEYWFKDTTIIVHATLWTVVLIEIIIPLHWLVRRILQFSSILIIHIIVLDIQFNGRQLDSISTFFDIIFENATPFYPYIWFSVIAWIIQLVLINGINTKGAIYSVFISSVILFACIDSFSFYILWDQAAIIIFSGLLIAVIQHFSEFKKRHPSSWEYFRDYPSGIISMVLIIISFVMVAGVMAPNVRPLIVDPYTAWKHSQGEAVETFGKGFDGFKSAFERDSTSGYRRDDSLLGGGFRFDFSEVMTVDTSHRSYLRGETRSVYTGLGWEKNSAEEVHGSQDVTSDTELDPYLEYDTSKLETKEIRQTVTMISETVYPILFGAFTMEVLELIDGSDGEFPLAFWSPENSVMHWAFEEEYYPQVYSLVSQMPIIDEEGLRAVSADTTDATDTTDAPDSLNPLDLEPYKQLPEELPLRISELAQTITGDQTNRYDKVKELENYLRTEFPYTNEPDLSKATSEDFVDSFLFEIKEGYCDYFSTAMVVLARTLDIPARWVKGYSSGTLPIEDIGSFVPEEILEADPNMAGEYTVRNSDAHSWVEVYFEGYGWIPFEPTSGFTIPTVYPEEAMPEVEQDNILPVVNEETVSSNQLPTWLILSVSFGIILLLIVLIMVMIRMGMFASLRRMGSNRADLQQNHKVVYEFNRLLRYVRKKGYAREEHETVREIIARWMQQNKWLVKDFEGLMLIFEKAKYSNYTLSNEEYHHALRLCKKLREEIK